MTSYDAVERRDDERRDDWRIKRCGPAIWSLCDPSSHSPLLLSSVDIDLTSLCAIQQTVKDTSDTVASAIDRSSEGKQRENSQQHRNERKERPDGPSP